MNNKILIVTSINKPSQKFIEYKSIFDDCSILWVGDKKSIPFKMKGVEYISVKDQIQNYTEISNALPFNHYSRKNIGYIIAKDLNAEVILDTDDDNFPLLPYKHFPHFNGEFLTAGSSENRINIYKFFTSTHIWPRGMGFPLPKDDVRITQRRVAIGVWQGLVSGDPDVDAIYRLAELPNCNFKDRSPIVLNKGQYCPFNSQNTLWRSELLPLCYIPSTVTFRFSDILRAYVAQKIMWEFDYLVGFCSPNAFQERNFHNLLEDLDSEISMYNQIPDLIRILQSMEIKDLDLKESMRTCYRALVENSIVQDNELHILDLYLAAF